MAYQMDEDYDEMKRLLRAMQQDDKGTVKRLAYELFITSKGTANPVEIQVFERFAPCRITISPSRGKSGEIRYGEKIFVFG